MRFINFILACLFILFAYFQRNDPDPFIWIAAYLISAGLLLYSFFKPWPRLVWILWEMILMLFILTYIKDIGLWIADGFPSLTGSMKASTPYIENIRESLGLLIMFIVFAINHILFYKSSNKR